MNTIIKNKNRIHFWSLYLSLFSAIITFLIGVYVSFKLQEETETLAHIQILEKMGPISMTLDSICLSIYQDVEDYYPDIFSQGNTIVYEKDSSKIVSILRRKEKYFNDISTIIPIVGQFGTYGIPSDQNKVKIKKCVLTLLLGRFCLDNSIPLDGAYLKKDFDKYRQILGVHSNENQMCDRATKIKLMTLVGRDTIKVTVLKHCILLPTLLLHQYIASEVNGFTRLNDDIDYDVLETVFDMWDTEANLEMIGQYGKMKLNRHDSYAHRLGKFINKIWDKHEGNNFFVFLLLFLLIVISIITILLYNRYGEQGISEEQYYKISKEVNNLNSMLQEKEDRIRILERERQNLESDIQAHADLTNEINRLKGKIHRMHTKLDEIDICLSKVKEDPQQLLRITDELRDLRFIIASLDNR